MTFNENTMKINLILFHGNFLDSIDFRETNEIPMITNFQKELMDINKINIKNILISWLK